MADERFPLLLTEKRRRRRGPRSICARIQRDERTKLRQQHPRGGGLCESKPEPLWKDSDFTLLNINIRGYNKKKNHADLVVHLEIIGQPSFVGITETWMTENGGCIPLPGYTLVFRRDRSDGRIGGGVIIFAHSSVADAVSTVIHFYSF